MAFYDVASTSTICPPLHLGYNELQGELPRVGAGSQLEALYVSGNYRLSGDISVAISNASGLRELGIARTEVSGFIEDLAAAAPDLEILDARGSKLAARSPESAAAAIASLKRLTHLSVADTPLGATLAAAAAASAAVADADADLGSPARITKTPAPAPSVVTLRAAVIVSDGVTLLTRKCHAELHERLMSHDIKSHDCVSAAVVARAKCALRRAIDGAAGAAAEELTAIDAIELRRITLHR